MRFIYFILSTALFILLLGFGLKNTEPVVLHYYLGIAWQAPLSLMILIILILGITAGIVALLPIFIKQRRDIVALNREIQALKPDS
jgi:lipopolysaccharide assembly protein A